MSVCAQTEEDSATEEMGAPIRDIYEQKAASKVVRVLTVLAYLLSVSLAAILLSVYYICVWKSPELPLLNDTAELSARRADSDLAAPADSGFSAGGSNITVNENATEHTIANITEGFPNETVSSEPTASDSDFTEVANASTPVFSESTSVDVSGDNGGIT